MWVSTFTVVLKCCTKEENIELMHCCITPMSHLLWSVCGYCHTACCMSAHCAGSFRAVHGKKSTHCNSLKHCALQKALCMVTPKRPTRINKAQFSVKSCNHLTTKQNKRDLNEDMPVQYSHTGQKWALSFCLTGLWH